MGRPMRPSPMNPTVSDMRESILARATRLPTSQLPTSNSRQTFPRLADLPTCILRPVPIARCSRDVRVASWRHPAVADIWDVRVSLQECACRRARLHATPRDARRSAAATLVYQSRTSDAPISRSVRFGETCGRRLSVVDVDEDQIASYRHLTEANAETLAGVGLRRARPLVGRKLCLIMT